MATTSTSARFTRSWVLSNASGTPKRWRAVSADSRRLVDSAVISKSFGSDFKAGMCACAAQPRSGLAPMIPTRILFNPSLLMLITLARSGGLVEHVTGDLPAIRAASEYEQLPIFLGAGRSSGHNSGGALRMGPRI